MDNIFSQEQINEIIEKYKSKINIDEICGFLNVDEHTIRIILKDNQLDRHHNWFSEELHERIKYLYSVRNYTLKRISYDLLISTSGISSYLNKVNVKRRSYSDNNQKYARNKFYFDSIDSPNKAYILGLLYADGNNCVSHNAITLSLQEEDYDLLEVIRKELEYEHPLCHDLLHEKNPNHKNQYRLVINDEHISQQLEALGVVNNKSLILSFPTFLRSDLIRHFVRGYFDGDGCVYYDKKRNKCTTQTVGTYDVCSKISSIMTALFINNNIRQPKQSIGKNTYIVSTSANVSSYKFLSWLYQDCELKMKRKYETYLYFCEKYLLNV